MRSIQLRRLHGGIERIRELLGVKVIAAASLVLIAGATLFMNISSAVTANGVLTACTPVVSADQRLRKEQWAIDGYCDNRTRTRVTDRYLGLTCSKGLGAAATFLLRPPAFDTKAFGIGRFQQCFDAVVTSTEMEFVVNRVREWVTSEPGNCEWDSVLAVLPQFRGTGLGSRLLALADETGERLKKSRMSVIVADNNTGARRLYEKFGYAETARRPIVKEGWLTEGREWVLLTKEL